jgi:site-specific recombinase XerD
VTLGSGTADMIRRHVQTWAARAEPEQGWLFSPSLQRSAHLTAGALSYRLARLGAAAGIEHAALHRLRHGVATYLVGHGRLASHDGGPVGAGGCQSWQGGDMVRRYQRTGGR